MDDVPFHEKFQKFLGRWTHIFKALAKRNNCKSHPLKVLHHLDSPPTVKGNFHDVVLLTEFFDELLDEGVVNHVSLRRHDISLLVPDIIRNRCSANPEWDRVFWDPEERKHDVFLRLVPGWEHKNKSRDIPSAG